MNVNNHFHDDFLISSQPVSLPTMSATKPLAWLCVLTSEVFWRRWHDGGGPGARKLLVDEVGLRDN